MGQATNVMQQGSFEIEPLEYIKILHSNGDGFICLAHGGETKKWDQWHYKYEELEDIINEEKGIYDTFLSMNKFVRPKRQVKYLKSLCNLWVDIDCYNTDYTKQQVLFFLENDLYGKKIPRPTLEVDSGKGLYLIWKINNLPKPALPLWNAVQNYLWYTLKRFGADAVSRNCTKILRLPHSVNSKSKSTVTILDYYDYIYDIREIQNEYMPEYNPDIVKKEIAKRKEKKNKKVVKRNSIVREIYNSRSLNIKRAEDIKTLCELRDYACFGSRDNILFLYRLFKLNKISLNKLIEGVSDINKRINEHFQETLDLTNELNSKFDYPLPERRVKEYTSSAEKSYIGELSPYNYSNRKLIEILNITDAEQSYLDIIISQEERIRRQCIKKKQARRNDKGLTKRQAEKVKKVSKIARIIEDNPFTPQAEIAAKLGINQSVVSRYLKEIRKNGINRENMHETSRSIKGDT